VLVLLLPTLLGCARNSVDLGDFAVTVDPETAGMVVERGGKTVLELDGLDLGAGSADIRFSEGSYLFDHVTADWTPVASLKIVDRQTDALLQAELRDAAGAPLASLQVWPAGADLLGIRVLPFQGVTIGGETPNRARATLSCAGGGPFLGAGGQALDVDHQGEAFSLWVSEPGIGKVDSETPPDDWFLTGTRHASSYPSPFLLRPELPVGLVAATAARVDLDLCASDPDHWQVGTWEGGLDLYVVGGDMALQVVEHHALAQGGVTLPPDAAFGPWNDAIRGKDRVLEVASELRAAGAPTGYLWTEDWKGATQTGVGYHLSQDWYVDEDLYPDPAGIASSLKDQGFAWMSYFSPFVGEGTRAWGETQDFLVHDAQGAVYTWPSPTLETSSALDLTDPDAIAWAQDRMTENLDIGFAGWMADYAEWLPTDAVLYGADALTDHNAQRLWWQSLNAEVLADHDATCFVRSGWTGTPSLAPVVWGGDQRTSFDSDDGFPTVLPLGIGLGISGVALYGSDIAGYASIGNPTSTQELWFRWAWLGAFSPIMRTHHGAYDDQNILVDSNEQVMAHWVRTATEHSRLFPYLRGLAALAQDTGRPLVLHPGLVYAGYDWARIDAWLLGSALFVAPVLEEGATGRQVELPPGDWYDWWTGAVADSGWKDAAVDEIPVFAAAGSVVPMLQQAPDTFIDGADASLSTLADVDDARLVRVFGPGGRFTEADGTTYTASGQASAAGTATDTFSSGSLSVGGLQVDITGTASRAYTIEVWP